MYRNRNPEVFQFCSQFLNTKLGAINTGILLFSSLTMAWSVRAAQLKQHKLLVGLLGATLGCASMFLGVKAVEYSHKFSIGLLPGKHYVAQMAHPVHSDVDYLGYITLIPMILTALAGLYYVYALVTTSRFHLRVAGPVLVAGLCFFGGVELGKKLEDSSHGDHGAHAASHDGHAEDGHAESTGSTIDPVPMLAAQPKALHDVAVNHLETEIPNADVNNQGKAGLFFSIYYCMTGVHAVHIIGGMIVIVWLIVKAAREEFHSQYFGPVDNVGLYWHLVDFIWIYLFPLLYLIR